MPFAGGNLVEQILRGLFAHALEFREGVQLQRIQVGDVLHQSGVDKLIHELVTEPIDVYSVAAGKVPQRFFPLGGAGGVDAAVGDFAFGAVDDAAALRAIFRHLEGAAVGAFLG